MILEDVVSTPNWIRKKFIKVSKATISYLHCKLLFLDMLKFRVSMQTPKKELFFQRSSGCACVLSVHLFTEKEKEVQQQRLDFDSELVTSYTNIFLGFLVDFPLWKILVKLCTYFCHTLICILMFIFSSTEVFCFQLMYIQLLSNRI